MIKEIFLLLANLDDFFKRKIQSRSTAFNKGISSLGFLKNNNNNYLKKKTPD